MQHSRTSTDDGRSMPVVLRAGRSMPVVLRAGRSMPVAAHHGIVR